MSELKINNKKEWEDLLESSLKKYYSTRKSCQDFFIKNHEKWSELAKVVESYDESQPLDISYLPYDKQLNDLFYFKQIFFFERKTSFKKEILELGEVDVLALAIFPDVLSVQMLNEEIYKEAMVFCSELEYSEENFLKIYEKFVGRIGENYPMDFNEYSKVIDKEKELLDAVFFWSKYKYKTDLVEMFKEVNGQ